jgi:biopolymer transport protein TolR
MSFGRLERSHGPQPMSEINMTPLVDVMLVLVVIFIITAPLLVGAVKVDLPKSDSTSPMGNPQFVALSVNKEGQVFVGDRQVQEDALAQELRQLARQHPDAEVQLRADTQVSYGRVLAVMGLAHKAGLNRIGFVAEVAQTPSH